MPKFSSLTDVVAATIDFTAYTENLLSRLSQDSIEFTSSEQAKEIAFDLILKDIIACVDPTFCDSKVKEVENLAYDLGYREANIPKSKDSSFNNYKDYDNKILSTAFQKSYIAGRAAAKYSDLDPDALLDSIMPRQSTAENAPLLGIILGEVSLIIGAILSLSWFIWQVIHG